MPISVFTSFLCSAIQDKYIIREGRKSLFDIKKLIIHYLEVWNRKNPNRLQNPIFRANMGGTIFFDVEDYEPYESIDSYKEYDNFIIYEIEPSHHISAKRYAVKVILKNPCILEEIAIISQEIVQEVKNIEVYSNQISENRFKGKLANIVWVYFCRSHTDIKHGNYICHTTWVDDSQDKEWWYKVDSKKRLFINNTHFDIHSNYEYLHKFIIDNTGEKDKIVLEVQELLSRMITLAEKIIFQYNEFKNGIINESGLVKELSPFLKEIDDCFFKSTELEIADDTIHEWDEACISLFALVNNFIYYYNEKYISSRNPKNRVACMDMTIRDYYIALNKVKEFEEQVSDYVSRKNSL